MLVLAFSNMQPHAPPGAPHTRDKGCLPLTVLPGVIAAQHQVSDVRWDDSLAADGFEARHWRKSSQWATLTRRHAELVAADELVIGRMSLRCRQAGRRGPRPPSPAYGCHRTILNHYGSIETRGANPFNPAQRFRWTCYDAQSLCPAHANNAKRPLSPAVMDPSPDAVPASRRGQPEED